MRLLLTGDLRYRLSWFKWLETQAVNYDAVAISGDVLDVFNKEPLKRQMQRAAAWLRNLASKSSVVLCSGNHDTIDIPVERSHGPIPAWLAQLENVLTADGNTIIIQDQIVVTSLGFIATAAQKHLILAIGDRLREEKRLPWIVLHHHPPAFHEEIGEEETIARRLVQEFSPTFWLSGRLYGQEPFLKRRRWIQMVGKSVVLNTPQLSAGQDLIESPSPNHVVLDLTARKITWHSPLKDLVDEEEFTLGRGNY
jgi:hypothetical protein